MCSVSESFITPDCSLPTPSLTASTAAVEKTRAENIEFEKWSQPLCFKARRANFQCEVSHCSSYPRADVESIGEVELVRSFEELRLLPSYRGKSMPDFEVPDSNVASMFRNILQRNLKRTESESKKKGGFSTRRQIA